MSIQNYVVMIWKSAHIKQLRNQEYISREKTRMKWYDLTTKHGRVRFMRKNNGQPTLTILIHHSDSLVTSIILRVRARMCERKSTHTHTHTHIHARTHTHTHTPRDYVCVTALIGDS